MQDAYPKSCTLIIAAVSCRQWCRLPRRPRPYRRRPAWRRWRWRTSGSASWRSSSSSSSRRRKRKQQVHLRLPPHGRAPNQASAQRQPKRSVHPAPHHARPLQLAAWPPRPCLAPTYRSVHLETLPEWEPGGHAILALGTHPCSLDVSPAHAGLPCQSLVVRRRKMHQRGSSSNCSTLMRSGGPWRKRRSR